jgi:NAD-dependent deacetylase
VAIITQGPTPWDDRAAVKLDGDVVAELEALVAAL